MEGISTSHIHVTTYSPSGEGRSSQSAPPPESRPGSRNGDRVTLSPQAREAAGEPETESPSGAESRSPSEQELSAEELSQLRELQARDQEVRAHEQAHLAVAGQYAASGASFTYQRGPDGNNYAIGGEVQIDISKESSPEETLEKMAVISRAALAPANPSAADRQIAAKASATAAQARAEISRETGSGENEESGGVSIGGINSADQGEESPQSPEQSNQISSSMVRAMIQSYENILALG